MSKAGFTSESCKISALYLGKHDQKSLSFREAIKDLCKGKVPFLERKGNGHKCLPYSLFLSKRFLSTKYNKQ